MFVELVPRNGKYFDFLADEFVAELSLIFVKQRIMCAHVYVGCYASDGRNYQENYNISQKMYSETWIFVCNGGDYYTSITKVNFIVVFFR